jgi:hypothetical protein
MVVLQGHGRWQRSDALRSAIQAESGTTPVTATAALRSARGSLEVWYDPSKWSSPGGIDHAAAEFTLRLRRGDAYALAILERIEVERAVLRTLVLDKARTHATGVTVLREEERPVNGIPALWTEVDATLQGIPFRFFYLFLTGRSEAAQILAWTPRHLADEHRPEIEGLLDGTVFGQAPARR